MIKIDNKYDFGQIVYLKTDKEQKPRIVTRITIGPSMYLLYELSSEINTSPHYEMEISPDKDVVLSTSG